MVNTLVLDGALAVRWHRFIETTTDEEMAPKIAGLVRTAEAHGHEYHVMRSFFDAQEEARNAQARRDRMLATGASSFVAAGFKERHLYLPILNVGLFEGEIFNIFSSGAEAGVRLIFVGSRPRFESMPYMLMASTDTSGVLCGCTGGF